MIAELKSLKHKKEPKPMIRHLLGDARRAENINFFTVIPAMPELVAT